MARNNQHRPITWRDIDFSSIKETYVSEPAHDGTARGSTILYIIMSLLLGPIALIFLPLFVGTRKGNVRLGFFKAIHYLVILPALAIAVAVLMVPSLLVASSISTFSTVISGFFGALYFFTMMIAGTVSINSHHLDISQRQKQKSKVPIWLRRDKVYGTAGDLSTARGKFADKNIDKGEDGEKRTAELLEALLAIPGTRIFHGVQWPGSKDADIDHIAVNGNKIAVIDSKLWSGQKHVFTSKGHVTTFAAGNKKYYRDIHLPFAIRDLNASLKFHRLRNIQLQGWIAVHTGSKRKANVSNAYNRIRFVTLSPAVEAIEEIGHWFASGLTGEVRIQLMDDIMKRVK